MHVTGIEFAVVALAIFVGGMVQGSLGFGMVLVAFPVLVIASPDLLPQATLIVSVPMVFKLAWQHRGGTIWRDVGLLSIGRLPGTFAAILILTIASARTIGLLAGVTVLGAVAVSYWAPAVPKNTVTLLSAGFVSALFGTTVAIGGPPLALLFQHEQGPQLRSTMTALMLFGAPVSLAILAITGQVSDTDLRTGLALAPCSLLGSYSARWLIPHVDERLRPIVLGVCALGAMIAITRLAFS